MNTCKEYNSKVFVGGSIGIKYLNNAVEEQLKRLMDNGVAFLIGDAYGADNAVQDYLNNNDYSKVTVYASNGNVRNNKGNWKIKAIDVPNNVYGRKFYTQKDIAMTDDCDYGYMIWDGKSEGTLANIYRLLDSNKTCYLYLYNLQELKVLHCHDDLKFIKE